MPGLGSDLLYGGQGDDLYVYTYDASAPLANNVDQIFEAGGTDTIHLSSGLSLEDITFESFGTDDLRLKVNGFTNKAVEIDDQESFSTNLHVETLAFDDGFTMDLSDYSNWHFVSGTFNGDNNDALGVDLDDTIIGSAGSDVIDGLDANDTIHGMGGNDTITGGNGNDSLHGGSGNDSLSGLFGDDSYHFTSGDDLIIELGGADKLVLPTSVAEADISYLRYTSAQADLVVKVDDGDGNPATALGSITIAYHFLGTDYHVEELHYGAGQSTSLTDKKVTTLDDVGTGSTIYGVDYGVGSNPDDTVFAGISNDIILAGAGDDTVFGGAGNDDIAGGSGIDWLYGEADNDTIYGEGDADIAYGQEGDDILYGGAGDDYLYGDYLSNATYGGNDNLSGDAGNDNLRGGKGADVLDGGADDDIILGW